MNKRGDLTAGYWLGGLFSTIIVFMIAISLFSNEGKIIVQKNFHEELVDCKTDLARGLEACPGCREASGSILLMFFSFCLAVVSMLLYAWSMYKVDNKQKELSQLENSIREARLKNQILKTPKKQR